MDINDLRGISTAFLLVVFIALVFWAYSRKRKEEFDEAANLPFADENLARRNNQESSSNQEGKQHHD
jgi:cytochrome c oxidase cbb3-type subunit 4